MTHRQIALHRRLGFRIVYDWLGGSSLLLPDAAQRNVQKMRRCFCGVTRLGVVNACTRATSSQHSQRKATPPATRPKQDRSSRNVMLAQNGIQSNKIQDW